MSLLIQMYANNPGMCDSNELVKRCLDCDGEGICCKVPQWASWESWTPCMNTCGPEETTRMRVCDYDEERCIDVPDLECQGGSGNLESKDCGNPLRGNFHFAFLL